MATLVLQVVGGAIGAAFGGPVGAAIGRTLGAFAGSQIDAAVFGESPRTVEGPRLAELDVTASSEGAPIPRVYGRARIGGQVIWATKFEEVATTERVGSSGGKATGPSTRRTTYTYFANLAVGLCEGPIAFVRRIWADGRELDLAGITFRVHPGDETQEPDPLIVAKEGAANAPAYRGLAYVVFERLALESFGNRVPQFSFEVVRAVEGLPGMIRGVCLIPGATEFGYDPGHVGSVGLYGQSRPRNRHQLHAPSDVAGSLDALQGLMPSARRVSVVTTWFGDDLRAGECKIRPKIETQEAETYGAIWSVSGLTRGEASAVSLAGGSAAYGGTPSDDSLVRLIGELKARGLEPVLYPFVMMDIPAGNALPDPWSGGPSQPAYPWRGRITCDPAPGRAGSPDGMAAAASAVASFFGTASPDDFAVDDGRVVYSGPDEWSYRRLILHYAHLAVAAGGVEAFILGSEFAALTRVRSDGPVYPAVAQLMTLAEEVRVILGPTTKIVYAADWTEYGAHVRNDGADIRFPLDPLFAHPAIDAIGIDYYPPISDWRDGRDHLDAAEASGASDLAYLRRRLGSGEAFDWYYASDGERAAQIRRPIEDGAYGKPWIYRAKDLVGWWSNPHVERSGGVEGDATSWTPCGKPIWLTEIGVPAVDKGPNAPNVFPDPKSSESRIPPFSNGARDDLAQTRGLEAILTRFDPALAGFEEVFNPVSLHYGGRMVDPANIYVWAWDARPFPAFPDFTDLWSDGGNWAKGHWLNGRIEGAPLDRLIAQVLADFDIADGAPVALDGYLDGYAIDRPMSARAALEPLARLFGVDAHAQADGVFWTGRGARTVIALAEDDLARAAEEALVRHVRAQESELPLQIELAFIDGETEYRRATVGSRRLAGGSRRETRAEVAAVLRRGEAQRLADAWLQDLWAGRETAEFTLGPRHLGLEPADAVALAGRLYRVVRIADGPTRKVVGRAVEPAVFALPPVSDDRARRHPPVQPGRPLPIVLDLPIARGTPTNLNYLAVAASPWPGAVEVWRSADGASFAPHRTLLQAAMVGRTLNALPPGPLWRFDTTARLEIELGFGSVASIGDQAMLAGGNAFAVEGPDGRWEILTAAEADIIGSRRFRLSRLLRGLGGSEGEAGRLLAPGARIVRLDDAISPLAEGTGDLGVPWRYRVVPAGRDHADPTAADFTATAGPDALEPLAPVHLRARRESGGIRFGWIRRTRIDGDPWEPLEVPLGEESEAYELDILDGGSMKRTLASSVATLLYPADEELADFGTPQTAVAVRLAQLSASVGRGFVAEAVLTIT